MCKYTLHTNYLHNHKHENMHTHMHAVTHKCTHTHTRMHTYVHATHLFFRQRREATHPALKKDNVHGTVDFWPCGGVGSIPTPFVQRLVIPGSTCGSHKSQRIVHSSNYLLHTRMHNTHAHTPSFKGLSYLEAHAVVTSHNACGCHKS
jgi:hypothetical protein